MRLPAKRFAMSLGEGSWNADWMSFRGDMAELVDATDLKNNIWAFFEKSKKWKLSNSEKLMKK